MSDLEQLQGSNAERAEGGLQPERAFTRLTRATARRMTGEVATAPGSETAAEAAHPRPGAGMAGAVRGGGPTGYEGDIAPGGGPITGDRPGPGGGPGRGPRPGGGNPEGGTQR